MANCPDIELLIPWYVNGTLNEAEMDRVNRHLRDCSTCAASVEQEVRFARELRQDPAGLAILTPATTGWGAPADGSSPGRSLQRRRPVEVSGTIAALTLAVAVGSFLLGQHLDRPAYRAMTSPDTHDGPVVQVMFEPETPEHVIRGVVLESGGTLVAGPTATGIYRIGLSEAGAGRDLVARLERSRAVRWTALEQP